MHRNGHADEMHSIVGASSHIDQARVCGASNAVDVGIGLIKGADATSRGRPVGKAHGIVGKPVERCLYGPKCSSGLHQVAKRHLASIRGTTGATMLLLL